MEGFEDEHVERASEHMHECLDLIYKARDELSLKHNMPNKMNVRLACTGAIMGQLKVALAHDLASIEDLSEQDAMMLLDVWAFDYISKRFPQYAYVKLDVNEAMAESDVKNDE